jgi:hypothetical protein
LPAIENGVLSDLECFNENKNEHPPIPTNAFIDIEASSESEGEGQLTCAICYQVIENDNEHGYSKHEKCNLNYHHFCLMHARERSFNNEKPVKCMECKRHIFEVYDSDRNITYGQNEETDKCIWCFEKLNTRFALGKVGCGQCKIKLHWKCLASWANKAKEKGGLNDYFPYDNMYKCFVCKEWGKLQWLKHGD